MEMDSSYTPSGAFAEELPDVACSLMLFGQCFFSMLVVVCDLSRRSPLAGQR